MEEVKEILKRNGFKELSYNYYSNSKCDILFHEDYYEVEHYDKDFLEYMTWFSDNLNIPALMGYLSWMDFIERGYEK